MLGEGLRCARGPLLLPVFGDRKMGVSVRWSSADMDVRACGTDHLSILPAADARSSIRECPAATV